MQTSSLYRFTLSAIVALALLALPGLMPSADAAPLEGTVLGDAGQPIDGALVRVSPAAAPDSFEQDFDGWEFNQDIAGLSEAERTTEIAFDGDYSVRFLTTGRFDDGTAWLQKRFFLAPDTTYQVHLSWYQTNLFTTDIGRWPVVAFAGTEAPDEETDFTEVGRDSAAEAFTRYELNEVVTTDSSGQIVLAFGISVVFEVDRAHFFDFVRPSIVEVDDIVRTTTAADGTFEVNVAPGEYRVGAEAKGFLPDVDVPVKTGKEDASLELIKIEDVWSDEITHRLVDSAGSGEKLFIFASLTTPSGVLLDGAECIGDLDFENGFGGFLTAVSDNGTCTFVFEPSDGIVPRGTATFELLDVEAEGKTHAPERSTANPAKFEVQ